MTHASFRPARFLRALACALALTALRTAHAHSFCVSTSQELQDALDAVSDGGAYVNEDNGIDLVEGTYRTGTATGGDAFHSSAMNTTGQLFISGGYRAGCGNDTRLTAPKTIIDAHGISGGMRLVRPNAGITVEWLTFENGEGGARAGGLSVNDVGLATVTGAAYLFELIFSNNHSSGNAGGLYAVGGGGANDWTIHMDIVLLAGNSSDVDSGAAMVYAQSGQAVIYHITVADNHAPAGASVTGGLYCGSNESCDVQNSIFRGNTNFGLTMAASSWNSLQCSDVGTLGGRPLDVDNNNVSVAPRFVDAAHGDYHLAGDSPLIASCWPNWPVLDLDNHPFSNRDFTEMGAYAETIFIDGFEPTL